MKSQFLLVVALLCIYANGGNSHPHQHDEEKRQIAAAPAFAESPADTLMRLKLLTYQEKLKAKETKKQAKVEKKAQKDAAFSAYMSAIAAGAMGPVLGGTPGLGTPTAPVAISPLQTIVPPMPMLPAMGLWKKSFLLSQIMAAAAAQNAAIAAAAATTTTTTTTTPLSIPTQTPELPVPEDDDDDDETQVINDIVKRYAPILRKKFYGLPEHRQHYKNEESEEEIIEADENEAEDETEDVELSETDDDEDENPAGYQSGSFNKFGTGPAGSPNGVGYEDAKVNQAGCSGSHIHICSGTTVYLTNPDDVTNQNPILQNPELKPVETEDDETTAEEVSPSKHGRKRLHVHRH